MHREHDVSAVERAVSILAKHCRKLRKIYVDFIAGLPVETPEDETLSRQLMARLTRISAKICIHSHAFMPLPGTLMQFMPPGSVGKTTRATFEQPSKRGQEWGDWEEQEEIAYAIAEFRREACMERGPASEKRGLSPCRPHGRDWRELWATGRLSPATGAGEKRKSLPT